MGGTLQSSNWDYELMKEKSFYRQHSADIKIKIIKIKPVLLDPKGPKAQSNILWFLF